MLCPPELQARDDSVVYTRRAAARAARPAGPALLLHSNLNVPGDRGGRVTRINFVRPVPGQGVYAVGEVVHAGKTTIVTRSQVFSAEGKLVAAGQGTDAVSAIPLASIEGHEAS
ncbi:MAG TPA: PaaI family thioesterase [Methylomirabilota bacterium]|nr:PaaI family thioesterase [Methylomirabilota bacterium]